jgi:hypothetical protein
MQNPQLIADLRQMFRNGATPSRLIQHLVLHHHGKDNWFDFVQASFREAFSVPFVRIPDQLEQVHFHDLSLAHLNKGLVHEMIQTRHLWDTDQGNHAGCHSTWLDSLTAQDDVERFQQLYPAADPLLAKSWSYLDPKAQKQIQMRLANADSYYERVLILARLAERLQQRILELENAVQEDSQCGQGK